MNVIVTDATASRGAEEVAACVRRLLPADHVASVRPPAADDAAGPSLTFDGGVGVYPAAPPEGILPLVMLTCDHFDWDAELVILTGGPSDWARHASRLHDQPKDELDAFFSFDLERGARPAAFLDLAGTALPALVWFREASRFYSLTQQAIRKDARVGGEFTFGSMVRELYLSHADIAYQCDDRRPLRATTRVLDAAFC